ncbi:uncharacterized protein LOC133392180 isoform X2 [Anopheles gambiae]|nr:uncharacterized protein LOC133392180 isoform X2 [Anopheles gambiae]
MNVWTYMYLLGLFHQIRGQFKIVSFDNANVTHPSNGTGNVNFVQIKPIVARSSNESAGLSSKSMNESSRMLHQDSVPTNTIENRFIKLSIVNLTAAGDKTRERKIQQTVSNQRNINDVSFESRNKTQKPVTSTKFVTVVGYAKKSKIRSTTRAELDQKAKKSSTSLVDTEASSSRIRRNKYRNYKSRCRCDRIWNCVRIQISVARCAPDFFMCCF